MSEDFDIKQRTENIYERGRSENNKKLSDKHSKEDGETLERFYNRTNLDERRRKLLDDSKEENHVSGDNQNNR
ncbi:MAG TPA: hypothetical protein VEL11_04715 [Candidatus Bathyarchaeia archaeon]|nr:hypothetical protein [Candidatus Bathyarchaeia archaeon]